MSAQVKASAGIYSDETGYRVEVTGAAHSTSTTGNDILPSLARGRGTPWQSFTQAAIVATGEAAKSDDRGLYWDRWDDAKAALDAVRGLL